MSGAVRSAECGGRSGGVAGAPADTAAEVRNSECGRRNDNSALRTPHSALCGANLRAVGLKKSYRIGSQAVPVLADVSLEVRPGEFLAIIGQSGSGKSTLLHLLGTLDRPDEGEVWFAGRRIDNLSARRRDAFRNRQLGMIFQFYHLLPELTM